MEHIRSLSDEREALTLEFEAENEQLKSEVETLKQELEGIYLIETEKMHFIEVFTLVKPAWIIY